MSNTWLSAGKWLFITFDDFDISASDLNSF